MPALGSSAPSFALAHFVYPCPAFELGWEGWVGTQIYLVYSSFFFAHQILC
jgi:hypothetical protein